MKHKYDRMWDVCARIRSHKYFDDEYNINLVSKIASKYKVLLSDVGEALYG